MKSRIAEANSVALHILNEWHLWTALRMQALNRGMLARSRMLSSVRPR